MKSQKLSDLQLELLNIYSFNPDVKDLVAIKKILAKYFSDKLIDKVVQAVTDRNISGQELDQWLNE